ncbi:MAG: enoyl-CoA hydratase/isomerase family protein [SAR202 cluster bacterium]|nr:MAG: enoyl-CoA hydratase/isomerase family protein [SAR202 cluster bacterium]
MDYSNIMYLKENQVATITLNRPDSMNALSPDLLSELQYAISVASIDQDLKTLVIRGNYPNCNMPFLSHQRIKILRRWLFEETGEVSAQEQIYCSSTLPLKIYRYLTPTYNYLTNVSWILKIWPSPQWQSYRDSLSRADSN